MRSLREKFQRLAQTLATPRLRYYHHSSPPPSTPYPQWSTRFSYPEHRPYHQQQWPRHHYHYYHHRDEDRRQNCFKDEDESHDNEIFDDDDDYVNENDGPSPGRHRSFNRPHVGYGRMQKRVGMSSVKGLSSVKDEWEELGKVATNATRRDDLRKAAELLHVIWDKVKDNQVAVRLAFNTYLKACSKAGEPEEAERCLEFMKKKGVKITIRAMGKLLDAYQRNRRREQKFEMSYWLNRFQKEGFQADTVLFNTLITFAAKNGEAEQALKLFELLKMSPGAEGPSRKTYGSMVEAYGRAGNPEQLHIWINKTEEAGYKVDATDMLHLILSYCNVGEIMKAMQYLPQLYELDNNSGTYKYTGHATILHFLIRGQVKKGEYEAEKNIMSAIEFIRSSHKLGIFFDIEDYDKMAIKLLKMQKASVALEVFALSLESGTSLLSFTLFRLVEQLAFQGKGAEAANVIGRDRELRIKGKRVGVLRKSNKLQKVWADSDSTRPTLSEKRANYVLNLLVKNPNATGIDAWLEQMLLDNHSPTFTMIRQLWISHIVSNQDNRFHVWVDRFKDKMEDFRGETTQHPSLEKVEGGLLGLLDAMASNPRKH